jgi:phosphoenolpyruvate carboxylase
LFLHVETERTPIKDLSQLDMIAIQVFKVASEQDSESLGAYVISQGQTASDVLAVMLLQNQFGMTKANGKLMRVVPLFETLADLNNSPAQLERRKLMSFTMILPYRPH